MSEPLFTFVPAESPVLKSGNWSCPEVREIFVKWELLRIPYNVILICLVLLFLVCFPPQLEDIGELAGLVLLGAVVANVCYLAGPLAEVYITWLGLPTRWLRLTIFLAGSGLAGVLAIVCLFAVSYGHALDDF